MPKLKGLRAPARQPTPYSELNEVLRDLIAGAREVLRGNFVGAYLQGSFAVGDADEASDADFIVVMRRDVSPEELTGLEALHKALHGRPTFWGERLEGSYFPAAVLRRKSDRPLDPPGEPPRAPDWIDRGTGLAGPTCYPVLFNDNGGDELWRSEHDNTEVVRWVTREKGVVLAGPDPRALIEPVTPAALKAEIRSVIRRKAPIWADEAYEIDRNWLWAFFVTLGCRMLQSLETGEVASKKAATAWALPRLGPEWSELIEAAWAMGRASIPVRIAPAPPERAAQAKAFVRRLMALEAAMPQASAADRAREIIARRQARTETPAWGGPPRGGPPRGRGGRLDAGVAPPIRPGGRGRRG
ncbi:MAG: aminoglycoside adenylyltransferase domain-containing protein [Phenylobacterium sp.]|uniref:nucleotidyltransferase domain-containing protein n=1 Tax=Phenylobacterium sp. TaxID=1871053 RepID=UPI00391D0E0D